ncbi:hypothetical protein CL634_05360 [bacterium]|nr:hypothetical protein [bacterium]
MPLITDKEFNEYLYGKSVALVGPSANSTSIKQGEYIDSFDLVVRIKTVFVQDSLIEYVGKKTNMTYTSDPFEDPEIEGNKLGNSEPKIKKINTDLEKFKEIEFKSFCSTYPKGEWFFNRLEPSYSRASHFFNVRIMPDEPYLYIKKETDRPNSGFSAIIDLLSTPLKELYITGLDFHRSLYREDYRNSHWDKDTIENMMNDPDGTDTHQPDKQFKYFKYKMYHEDPRIIPDDFLKEYLNDEKYETCLSTL